MRLGLILRGVHNMPYRFRGKHRTVKQPTLKDLHKMREDFQREEQNMLILRHPYLTVEQSNGHMKDLRKPDHKDKMRIQALELRNEKFSRRITIRESFEHLRITEAWD